MPSHKCVRPSRDLPVGTTLFHDGLFSTRESEPGEQARGWVHNQQQEWIPAGGLPRPYGLKMTTVKTYCSPVQEKGSQIPCLYLQCGHHQTPNPQCLLFDLSAVSLHCLLELCWQGCTGPGRNIKGLQMKRMLFLKPFYLYKKSYINSKCYEDVDHTCSLRGTFRKPGWRIPTHMA